MPNTPPPQLPIEYATLMQIKEEMAEMRGQVTTDLKHLSHDIKNLLQALSTFVPRTEIEKENAALRTEIATLKEVVTKLERAQTWFTRQAILQWMAGGTIGATVVKALF